MLSYFSNLNFFLYQKPTDMRKSFDGLSGIVSSELGKNPLCGDAFVFVNRRRDRIKLLVWDGDGFWLFYKRLEKGTFEIPQSHTGQYSIELSWQQLMMIVAGIELSSVKMRKRYHRSG